MGIISLPNPGAACSSHAGGIKFFKGVRKLVFNLRSGQLSLSITCPSFLKKGTHQDLAFFLTPQVCLFSCTTPTEMVIVMQAGVGAGGV
jgi:hypothetical protein